MRRRSVVGGVALLAVGLGLGHYVDRAFATGVTSTGALTYTGTLLTYGAADNNPHQISVALWVTGASSYACQSPTTSITPVNGQFSVTLPDSCATIIHQNTNTEVQVTIDGSVMPFTTIGAVPYALEAAGLLPGLVMAYGAATAPSGWLLCNGANVSRTTYAALFAVIGSTYGAGDGSTTFTLPNLQGVFPRGAGSQTVSGVTYSTTLGQAQGDLMQGHRHVDGNISIITWGDFGNGWVGYADGAAPGNSSETGSSGIGEPVNDGTNGVPRYGTETRPANVGVNYVIKT